MIVVVRHGRTAANAGGLLHGRADPPLDREGERQAAALAAAVAELDVARVITSPLGRCRSTAAIVAAPGAALVNPGLSRIWLLLIFAPALSAAGK